MKALIVSVLCLAVAGCDTLPNGCAIYAAAATKKLRSAGVPARTLCVSRLGGEKHALTIYCEQSRLLSYDPNEGSRVIGDVTSPNPLALDIAEKIYPVSSIGGAWWVQDVPKL